MQPLNHPVAVEGDLLTRRARAGLRLEIRVPDGVLNAVDRRFEKRFSDSEQVMAQYPDRSVPAFYRTFVHPFDWHLPHVALRGPKDVDPRLDQRLRRKGNVSCATQSDKCGNGLEVLAEHELPAFCHDRHFADPELEEPLEALPVVEDVDGDEVHALLRKKLLRSKTAASAWLGVEDECVSDSAHGDSFRGHQCTRVIGYLAFLESLPISLASALSCLISARSARMSAWRR